MGHLVGIDLGTTNSAIAFTELGRQRCVKVDVNEYASAVMPSCVAVTRDGQVVVGARATREPLRVREFKRHMGEDHVYELGGRSYSALELSAVVLRRLKEGFEERHGPIEGAVVTVPAMFDERRRRETLEAGRVAGLNVLRVINEPSAAAIAYTLAEAPPTTGTVVVDWGGGTLDVSVIDGDEAVLDVLSNDGDLHLGGRDLDALVLDRLIERFRAEGHTVDGDPVAHSELALAAEQIKIRLSEEEAWDEPVAVRSQRAFVEFRLTRAEFEDLASPLLGRVFAAIERALDKHPHGSLAPRDVGDVILVGGTCRMPMLRRRIEEYFGRPGRISLDPMEVVALGAAYQACHAQSSAGAPVITLHSLTMNLGVECTGIDEDRILRTDRFACLLTAGTKIPAKATETFSTRYDGQTEILVRVFEVPWRVSRCGGIEPWDEHLIVGIPPAPAGSFPIQCTFEYHVDQTLTVTVEIPAHGIREEWKPRRLEELEKGRDASRRRVDGAFAADAAGSPGGTAGPRDLVDRVEAALAGRSDAPWTRTALGRLRVALSEGGAGIEELSAELRRAAAAEGVIPVDG